MSLEMVKVSDLYLMMRADIWWYTKRFQSSQVLEHSNLDCRA